MVGRDCPECGSYDTKLVDTSVEPNYVLQTRVCNDCPTQWSLEYGNPIITNIEKYGGN